MRRSSFEPANNAPASVVGEGPDKADQRKLAVVEALRSRIPQVRVLRSPAMTAHAESDTEPETAEVEAADDEDVLEDARRARWTATVTGALLALMGLTASSMRLGGVPALVPTAYGSGAVVCVVASALGARGRTRVALWLMILGTMVMALGDQFD